MGSWMSFVSQQQRLSNAFDSLLPVWFTKDGYQDFVRSFVPEFLGVGTVVYDVGCGRSPFLSAEIRREMQIRVVGFDIDAGELARAEGGSYERTICADICTHVGAANADVAICSALLEHVPDVEAALLGLAGIVKPGGVVLVFVPSRRAIYARLNRLLPEQLKRRILFTVFPHTRGTQGFPAFYDRCSPRDFRELAMNCGFTVCGERQYYSSGYFKMFFPLHVMWRFWMALCVLARGSEAAETFVYAMEKGRCGPAAIA